MRKALDEIHRLFAEGTLAGVGDGQLLERFAVGGDGEAFAEIVARHGPLVLATCRSALGPDREAEAEDAFQATFLVLVRRAGSFPLHGSLAGWLYRVARRVARQARVEATRRRRRERIATGRAAVEVPPDDPGRDELRRLVHQELARLPERYRTAILLCDLHGLTRDEAAEAIGCPPGTVAGRLARARDRLRGRLERRGVTASSAWTATLALPPDDLVRLAQRATHAALSAAQGAVVTTAAARLAAGASQGLFATRVATVLVLVVALAASCASAVLAFRSDDRPRAEPPRVPPGAAAPGPAVQAEAQPPIDPDDPATAGLFAGRVVDVEGRPLEGAKVYLVPKNPLPAQPGEVRAITAADGRFRFSAKDLTYPALDGLPARRTGLLMATARGYAADWVPTWGRTGSSFVSHWDPTKGAELTLTLARDDVPIRGRLLDPRGRPLAGASVALEGLYVPRKKDLDAHLETLKSRRDLFGSTGYDRTITTPGVLPGVETGAITDAEGRFRLDGLGRERLASLRIRGPGVADASIDVMTREAHDFRVRPEEAFGDLTGLPPGLRLEDQVTYGANFTFALEPGRTVTGVVRDKVTGGPLADVWVGPGLSAITALETGRSAYATDAQGRFAIPGLSSTLGGMQYAEANAQGGTRLERIVLAVPKPGQPYFLAKGVVNEAGEAVVECPRGIPFRLTLRDEAGRPVEAEVSYSAISPNASFGKVVRYIRVQAGSPLSRAARQADGSYLGVALPGPGVVVAETPATAGYRPAHVDPKAFFAPGRTDWTAQDLYTTYGTHDTLSVATFFGGGSMDQHDYAAIVLVNPPEGAKPLELAATVVRGEPRQVTLVDPEGRPVVGAEPSGLTPHRWDQEPRLRASTFFITGLHPDRARRITFVKEDRKLIGFLLARGDGGAPYTVRMRPWGTVTGRIVDQEGRPLGVVGPPGKQESRATLSSPTAREFAAHDDPEAGLSFGVSTDEHGRFRRERLVPGQSYSADISLGGGRPAGTAFEGLKLAPGEVRDLGDLRIKLPSGDATR